MPAGMTNSWRLRPHSGCKQLFLGLESISQQSMIESEQGVSIGWRSNLQIIRRIHSHGIACKPGLCLDSITIRRRYRGHHRFPGKSGSAECDFQHSDAIPRYAAVRKMETEGRILTRDWAKYNSRDDVVYEPKRMSGAELLAGFRYANERFYSLASTVKRSSRSRFNYGGRCR